MFRIHNPKDFWSGIIFIFFGLFFALISLHYRLGTAARMGPGYFPMMLSIFLSLVGGIILLRSLITKGERITRIKFQPLIFITLSLLLFAYLLPPLGLVLALAILIITSVLAGFKFHFKEVLFLCVLLIIFAVLVFAKGLGLPFLLWPKFLN
ncbi:MAG: tripartite tricarboxylate transporter TctB family protein [Thermodesulfobacteriota bacterium]